MSRAGGTNNRCNQNVGNIVGYVGFAKDEESDVESVKNKLVNRHKNQSNVISFYKIVKLNLGNVIVYGETNECFTDV